MKEYQVIFTEEATAGLSEIMDFIEQRNPENAKQFIARLAETFEKTLSMFPNGINAKKIGTRTMRKFSWKGYSAYYDVNEAEKLWIFYIFSVIPNKRKIS